ncbi:hypothetical protein LUD75_13350 [Epilithonimonas sp. JDS]|uniref:hypothetical protein n=1 Tax=Epilithonimonas sp. JDS TaxID=2902797 RepID=UPI001E49FBEE|nr:hypothetical protein [Epilithonimonas sp. JDS]MCD9855703.1 hypothetical protein [Epilithonimonas sp. JDS]
MKFREITLAAIISLNFFSCKKEIVKTSEDIKTTKDTVTQISNISTENPRNNVQHLFTANGGSILYLKNGEIKGQARFDTDGDFVTELMKTKTYAHYDEYDDYLIGKERGDTTFFLNEFGRIDEGWNILKGIDIENPMQIVSYKSPKNPNPKEIETISETRLIIFDPETKTFKDENSPEAENYFTAMDDWNFYSHELSESLGKLGVQTKYLNKRFLNFNLLNKNVIDTKSRINGANVQALLYKKGKMPIVVPLILLEEDLELVKDYLR